jgi:hypothetical protein
MNKNFKATSYTIISLIIVTKMFPQFNKPLIKIGIIFFINYIILLNYNINDTSRLLQSLLYACFGYVILLSLEKFIGNNQFNIFYCEENQNVLSNPLLN